MNREFQIKKHLKWKKFKNGCDKYNITEQDLINSIFIGGTNEKYFLFLRYNLKKYNINLNTIITYPNKKQKCLCNQKLTNLFYLYNQNINCIYVIGSECITNFNGEKIQLSCINCGRTKARYLDKNGICCNCIKFKCNKCYDNNIYKNSLCDDCHKGSCETCLKKIDNKFKYCFDCFKNQNQIKCYLCNIKYHKINFHCCFNCLNKIKMEKAILIKKLNY